MGTRNLYLKEFAMHMRKKTKTELLQEIVNKYIADGQPWPAQRKTIAAWAINNRLWDAPRKSLIDQCAEELADAMRAEMEVDPQGRTVHAKRCAKISEMDAAGNMVQRTLWFDRKSRTTELMNISQQQWRNSILGECRQHRIEQESFNDNNPAGDKIQHRLDFEEDLLDSEHGTSYNPPPPPPDDDDEEDEE